MSARIYTLPNGVAIKVDGGVWIRWPKADAESWLSLTSDRASTLVLAEILRAETEKPPGR